MILMKSHDNWPVTSEQLLNTLGQYGATYLLVVLHSEGTSCETQADYTDDSDLDRS